MGTVTDSGPWDIKGRAVAVGIAVGVGDLAAGRASAGGAALATAGAKGVAGALKSMPGWDQTEPERRSAMDQARPVPP